MMKAVCVTLAFAAVLTSPLPAAAQDSGAYRARVGVGAQSRPEFLGAGSNEWAVLPDFSLAREGEEFGFGAKDDSFDIKLLSAGGFSAGPVAAIASGRKRSDVDVPLDKVKTTIEAGAYAQLMAGENFRIRGELRKGIGGHEGLNGHVGADYVVRDGDRWMVSAGPRLRFSDGRFQRAFFGVSPAEALASSLPAYDPDGGIHAVGAIGNLDYALGGAWGLFGYARYDRLVSDAKRSPIVRQLGSPDQFSAGIGINHTFNVRF